MQKFNRAYLKYYVLFFLLNVVEMIMETSASRIFAPSLGATNAVWIAIIGVILLGNSVGNFAGGKLSETIDAKTTLGLILILAAIFIAVIPWLSNMVPYTIIAIFKNPEVSAIISTVLLFFLPTTILSMATPVLMKNMLSGQEYIGKISGQIQAVVALGSLVGVFLGGFVLIPSFGCKMILCILAATVAGSAAMFLMEKRYQTILACVVAVIMLGEGIVPELLQNPDVILDATNNTVVSIDGEYSRISIFNTDYRGERIRRYQTASSFSSATFLNEEKKYDLVFDYTKMMDKVSRYKNIHSVLMIGGAAYMYPKYYISHYPNSTMDVVEIEPKSLEIAKKYFFLDDLIQEYNLENNPRLGIYINDARMYLNRTEKKYDCIMNDAFSGGEPVATLASKEAIKLMKSHLTDDGIYMMNVIGSTDEADSLWIRSEYKTAKEVFPYVYVVYASEDYKEEETYNMLIVCSMTAIPFEKDISYITWTKEDIKAPAIILTDDYCPVEQIAHQKYQT